MKTLKKLLAILIVAVVGQSAFGVTYLFQAKTPNVFVDQEYWLGVQGFEDPIPVNPTASGQLSVASQLPGSQFQTLDHFGYDKNLHIVTSIEILFLLNSDIIDITFGNANPGSSSSVNLDNLDGILAGDHYVHEFDFGSGGLSGSLFMCLIDTGIFDWEVSLTPSQITNQTQVDLLAASLAVETSPRVSLSALQGDVPDSTSTLGLLSLGMIGLFGLKRRIG